MMTRKIIKCFSQFILCTKKITNCKHISGRKSKGLHDESIKPPAASPTLNYINTKLRVKFNGSYLKQDKVTYTQKRL